MSFSTIARAAADQHLIDRVTSAAHQVVQSDPDKANTIIGQAIINGQPNAVAPLMYPVAIDTEQSYETALLSMRGAPGFDVDIITDAALFAAVNAHWPMAQLPGQPT